MQMDDTKDKIYIHNLDEELADIDTEEAMVFLPDIEKKIGRIPQHLLTSDLKPTAHNQMVLYGVPSSLTLPKDKDAVRRTILESRARARENQLAGENLNARGNGGAKASSGPIPAENPGIQSQDHHQEDLNDAMDIT